MTEEKKKGKKKIDIKDSAIRNIFKTGRIGAGKIDKTPQSIYKSKYDQEIEDFINEEFHEFFQQRSSRFEIRLYTKACLFIKEYEEIIENLYTGINSEKYKGDEKSFVDNIYDCSKDFEIYFPKAEGKKDSIEGMRCKYNHVRDSSVRRWIRLITYYSLINKSSISFKRYYELLNYVAMNEMPDYEMRMSEYLNVFKFVFINSFIDFSLRENPISIGSIKNIENDIPFDHLLRKNLANNLANNEVIIILKSRIKEEENNVDFGFAFLVKNKESGAHELLKIVYYFRSSSGLALVTTDLPFHILDFSTENDTYKYLGSFPNNNEEDYTDITSGSFSIINRDNCEIRLQIDDITKQISLLYKSEIDSLLKSFDNKPNIPLDLIMKEGFTPYLNTLHIGKGKTIIADNNGVDIFDIINE